MISYVEEVEEEEYMGGGGPRAQNWKEVQKLENKCHNLRSIWGGNSPPKSAQIGQISQIRAKSRAKSCLI